jgi:sulfur-oxidizing protein SoxX
MREDGLRQLPMKFSLSYSLLLLLVLPVGAIGHDAQSPLTDQPGRADMGQAVFNDREKGHCLLCHQLSASSEPFQGTIGPSLDGVASRLTRAEIRYRIVDQSRSNPETVMPAYYRTDKLTQVAKAYRGKTVLTAQEIEDLIAYLATTTGERDG